MGIFLFWLVGFFATAFCVGLFFGKELMGSSEDNGTVFVLAMVVAVCVFWPFLFPLLLGMKARKVWEEA